MRKKSQDRLVGFFKGQILDLWDVPLVLVSQTRGFLIRTLKSTYEKLLFWSKKKNQLGCWGNHLFLGGRDAGDWGMEAGRHCFYFHKIIRWSSAIILIRLQFLFIINFQLFFFLNSGFFWKENQKKDDKQYCNYQILDFCHDNHIRDIWRTHLVRMLYLSGVGVPVADDLCLERGQTG